MNKVVFVRSILRAFFKLCISSILAVIFLSTVIYFYKYTLVGVNTNKVTNEVYYPNQFCSNMEEGFAWFNFDKNGFNNSYPVKKDKIDALLLGSSQLEAIQVKPNENIGYLLNKLFPDYYFYNIGVSGHYLPTIINNLPYAYNYFKPEKYIIIEIGNVKMELAEILSVLDGSIKRRVLNNNGFYYYLKKYLPLITALRFKLVQQTRLWKNNSSTIFKKANILTYSNSEIHKNIATTTNNNINEYKETLNKFLAFARKSVPDNITIIIFYHPYYELQKDGSLKNKTDEDYFKLFENACVKNNIIFVDTDNDLSELYKTKHILPYGFINTKICSGHLNKYGHEVIAKRLAKEISDLEGRKSISD